ncbi:MAG TPA: DUF4251 domain-containing protein [Bacteroidales bacterium]|jgi:hypothetical protein|nr:DUF4251 domain-containing protein [Bacteroidales bacterium]
MKTLKYLSAAMLVVFMAGFSSKAYSQEFFQDRELTKKEKKEARKTQLYANFKAIDTLLQNKTFVLEAQYLQDTYGSQVPVTSNLNFIRVDPQNVVMQTGTSSGMGYNGVGGVTAEGSLSNYKVSADEKHLSHTVTFSTITQIGTYDVRMLVGADATVTASITGLSRGRLTYRGNLVAPYNSRVFKGQRTN